MRKITIITQVAGYLRAIVAYVVRRRVDEKRLKIELYDRRIAVFNEIRDYTWGVASGNIQRGAEQKFLQSTEHVSFLFGKDIKLFVNEVFGRSGKLHALLTVQSRLHGKALEENLDKQNAIREWFTREAKGLEHRFAKYLNL